MPGESATSYDPEAGVFMQQAAELLAEGVWYLASYHNDCT